jgi:hypothetical protein
VISGPYGDAVGAFLLLDSVGIPAVSALIVGRLLEPMSPGNSTASVTPIQR